MNSSFIYLLSNFILTCYGLLVKSYRDVELLEQVYIRTVVFTFLSLALIRFQLFFSIDTIWLSILNFISIYGIYVAFDKLGLGITQALFYSWPLFFYIMADKQFNYSDLSILIITFLFVFLIYKPIDKTTNGKDKWKGLLGVIASIATHVYILTYFKKHNPPIQEYLYNQYAFILIALSLYYIWQYFRKDPADAKEERIDNRNYRSFAFILVFNLLLGYLGFYLQFLSVGNLEPYIISLLTFISIVISLFLDRIVFGQALSKEQWIGILGIIAMTALFRKTD